MGSMLGGLHHVTSFAGPVPENVAFHTDVLGVGLVKKTVNFDDPGTLHLYFADAAGSPGTVFTSFPSPRHAKGRVGTPDISAILVETDAGGVERAIAAGGVEDDGWFVVSDPDGLEYRVREDGAGSEGARVGGVAVRVPDPDETMAFLTDVLGFENDGGDAVLEVDGAPPARVLFDVPGEGRGRFGAGSIHHVAWRVPDGEAQARDAAALRGAGVAATPVQDRVYFRSIYFRIPGGVLFEVATDGPGFAVDEPADALGRSLKLPPWFESRRDELLQRLPEV